MALRCRIDVQKISRVRLIREPDCAVILGKCDPRAARLIPKRLNACGHALGKPTTENLSKPKASAMSIASCARATPLPSRRVLDERNRVAPNPRTQGATQWKPAFRSEA